MASATNLFRVDGLVAVITGGGSGLGRMMAHALASNGATKVYILGRRMDSLNETIEGYSNIIAIQTDVTDKAQLKAAAERIKSETGYVNTLIVNSGLLGPIASSLPRDGSISEVQEHFWAYSQDEMNQVFAVNNVASFFTAVAFLDLLDAGNKKQNRPEIQSSVIFTASIAGYARYLSTGVPYVQSKAGVLQQTKMLSTLLAKWGIRVNAIAPGIYPSEMTATSVQNPALRDSIPAHRFGSEEDIQGAVLFLTSRAGAYLNGEIMLTDGGRLGQMPASFW